MKKNNRTTFTIDGRQLTGHVHGGVQRYLAEIVSELDKIASPGDYEICIPSGTEIKQTYHNIRVVRVGMFQGLLWEQVSLPVYLIKKHRFGIYPCSVVPFVYQKGIAILHDIMFKTVPMVAKSINPLLRVMITRNFAVSVRHADLIGTVSDYSRQEIVRVYHPNPDKIVTIGNGWQHMNRGGSDSGWMKVHPELVPGEYYFSLSANRIQKNFKWIYEVAKRNPDRYFVMAGTQEEWQKQVEYDAPNLIHLGDISDETIRSLMEHCRAFLFPSMHEGFGIPPMEALAVGARIIVAKASCLPEIYRGAAYYIDPCDYEVDLDRLLSQKVDPPETVLSRYSWAESARRLDEARKRVLKMNGIEENGDA